MKLKIKKGGRVMTSSSVASEEFSVDDSGEKRPVGAPPKMKGGKKRFPYLDDVTVAAATRLGNGNLSEGLRLAVEPHIKEEDRAQKSDEVVPPRKAGT